MANSCEHPSDKIDVGGYCNSLVLDEEGYGDVCGVRVFPRLPHVKKGDSDA